MTEKLTHLINILKDMQSAVLAYSGGVDSTFLLKAMQLSNIRTLAVTAVSEIVPYHEVLLAKKMAEEIGIEHMIIETHELSNEMFVINTSERCFICKDTRFKILEDIAISEGYRFVLDGSNSDDLDDYRPGKKAAEKYGVRSPLIEANFSKKEIRELSQKLGLSTWNKPSSPCLATRIPYGQRITKNSLKRIERAENFLKSLGFIIVRVRDHYPEARIEVGKEETASLLETEKRMMISEKLKSLGFSFITIDPEGYKSGGVSTTAIF
ncbi:MAG: ATP-dependent sacrificial sulfur transferase LarE [Nitrospirota bacterium]